MAIINVGIYSNLNTSYTKDSSTNVKINLLYLLKSIVTGRSFFILIVSLFLLVLGRESQLQIVIGNSLFFLGLVTIGIPHGAVDHLLESGHWVSPSTPRFILVYLAYSFAMALFWYLSPKLALCLFLFYSAWHFGQSDGEQWGLNNMIAYLWGCFVIFYLLGTHFNETNSILKSISGVTMPFSSPIWLIIPFFFVAVYIRSYSFAITVLWLMVSSQLPLMLAFGLYFIGLECPAI
jgi:Brp/Blh family beta-carotene 15,15'-monooxygenase